MLAALDRVAHGVLRAIGARSSNVRTSAGTVHAYELRGPGEGTFTLLHGLGTTATSYTAVVTKLRPSASRIVLVDLPGHGRSSEPPVTLATQALAGAVREAIDALVSPRDRTVLLGTSLGGAAALRYALDRPGNVGALVLASPAGAPLDDDDLAELRRRFDLRTRADARRFFSELMHAPPFYVRALERGLTRELSRPIVKGILASIEPTDFFAADELSKLAPPTTVLWGKSDRILPRSGLAFYRSAMPPGTRFEELDDIGHSPHTERPALVADRLRAARSLIRSAAPPDTRA